MIQRDLTKIIFPMYIWRKTKSNNRSKENVALDTETTKGRCFLISDSYGNTAYIDNLYTLLGYLNSERYRKTNNWFYNLTYDTNALLKYLSFNDRREISVFNELIYEDYRIKITPDKKLSIGKINKDGKVKHQTSFYDLAQYYDMQKLKTLASQTQYNKVEVVDINELDEKRYLTDPDYRNLLNDRVVYDCLIAQELADQFAALIEPVVIPREYLSKASLSRSYIKQELKHSLKLPSKLALQAALNAYHAGMIESCKMGLFKGVKNYDIKSAYPSIMANLYSCDGSFKQNREYEPETAYSFYLIEIDYYDKDLSPLWVIKKGINYHPTGKLETWVTQMELEFFQSKGFDYKIKQAYHIMKNKDEEQPFHDMINRLYELRLEAKEQGNPIQKTYKLIGNSGYGATLNVVVIPELTDSDTEHYTYNEEHEIVFYSLTYKATSLYNPVFAAYITAGTRIQLFTDFYKYLKYIISVNTDGLYLQKSAHPHVPLSNKLGEYSYDQYDTYTSMGSGRYFVFNKDGTVDNGKSRFRSISKSPSEIYKIMRENKNADHLSVSKFKPIKLKESITEKKYHDKFNEFMNIPKSVAFSTDKRIWFDDFKNMDDVLSKQIESRPMTMKELKNYKRPDPLW